MDLPVSCHIFSITDLENLSNESSSNTMGGQTNQRFKKSSNSLEHTSWCTEN